MVAGQEHVLLLWVPLIQEDEPVKDASNLRPPVIVVTQENHGSGVKRWPQRLLQVAPKVEQLWELSMDVANGSARVEVVASISGVEI